MLKEKQKVEMRWHPQNKQYYIDRGYTFTKMRDVFCVNIDDLPMNSHAKVVAICDYCGKEMVKTYQCYNAQHDEVFGDACDKCCQVKKEATCMKNFGTKYPMQSNIVQNKSKNTCLKKYGVEHYSQSEECKEKIKQTSLEKYGVEYCAQSEAVKKKIRESNMQKYGVEYFMQTKEAREKSRQTVLRKYGVENVAQNKDIQLKIRETLYKNGNCPTSKQQLDVYEKLLQLYNNCELNFPVSNCSLDCMVIVDNYKIDVEYDGQHWHKDAHKDRKRDEFLKSQGYKILRIRGNRKTPTKEQLGETIDYLINNSRDYIEIALDI